MPIRRCVVFKSALDRLEGAAFEIGARKVDRDTPAGIVERIDLHAVLMLPVAVALTDVPLLKLEKHVVHEGR
jgi:hypothetical protein